MTDFADLCRITLATGVCAFANASFAGDRSFEFTFDWYEGPLMGQTTTGRFSFDESLFHPTEYVQAPQLFSQFSVEIDGRSFDEVQAPGHYLKFYPDGALRMMAVGNNCGSVTCYVDNPGDWSIAWDGGQIGYALYASAPNVFSYAEGISLREVNSVPEPPVWLLTLGGSAAIVWRLLAKRRYLHPAAP